jgi:hypothetical protein
MVVAAPRLGPALAGFAGPVAGFGESLFVAAAWWCSIRFANALTDSWVNR